ncbi:hypothetical protein [Janthinobacterium sp.]|uniref:hypothetical protein n=1 Tax=Janthinobacterium sp. TaxID=1871054 RepID=UPI00293D3624|nr:hypothetical protein [Janthinobacterium sp.]
MLAVFALTLVFADGYMGGSLHMRDYPTADACNKGGGPYAAQYTSRGHPASFFCVKVQQSKVPRRHIEMPTLVSP